MYPHFNAFTSLFWMLRGPVFLSLTSYGAARILLQITGIWDELFCFLQNGLFLRKTLADYYFVMKCICCTYILEYVRDWKFEAVQKSHWSISGFYLEIPNDLTRACYPLHSLSCWYPQSVCRVSLGLRVQEHATREVLLNPYHSI